MKKRILVVDDEWSILELLKFKLSNHGYEVVTAQNEKEFWERAFEVPRPDLIVLDIWLKNKAGTDIYDNLLHFGLDATIPVIFITALIENRAPKHAPAGGKYALYAKPFDFDQLIREIERFVSEPSGEISQAEPGGFSGHAFEKSLLLE